jgi:hypothetical protein
LDDALPILRRGLEPVDAVVIAAPAGRDDLKVEAVTCAGWRLDDLDAAAASNRTLIFLPLLVLWFGFASFSGSSNSGLIGNELRIPKAAETEGIGVTKTIYL